MADTPITTRLVRCPRCRKSVRYDVTNAFRPFCSAVCKNEDIVSWAEEGFRIAGEPAEGDEDKVRDQTQEEDD